MHQVWRFVRHLADAVAILVPDTVVVVLGSAAEVERDAIDIEQPTRLVIDKISESGGLSSTGTGRRLL